jgi:hypothetical protein
MAVQLPHAMEIAGPGAARVGVRHGEALKLPDRLHLQGHIQGINRQLHHPQGEGEQGLELKGAPRRWGLWVRHRFPCLCDSMAQEGFWASQST